MRLPRRVRNAISELKGWVVCHAASGWKGVYGCHRFCWTLTHPWTHVDARRCWHPGEHKNYAGDRW